MPALGEIGIGRSVTAVERRVCRQDYGQTGLEVIDACEFPTTHHLLHGTIGILQEELALAEWKLVYGCQSVVEPNVVAVDLTRDIVIDAGIAHGEILGKVPTPGKRLQQAKAVRVTPFDLGEQGIIGGFSPAGRYRNVAVDQWVCACSSFEATSRKQILQSCFAASATMVPVRGYSGMWRASAIPSS